MEDHPAKSVPGKKRQVLWSLLFLLIAAASIWAVISQNKTFSLRQYLAYLQQGNPIWLGCAFLSMLVYILLGAVSILLILRSFGYRKSFLRGFSYTSADLYFSAITPSATGGQPAAAVFMMRDGIPGSITTVTLLSNLAMYTVSIVLIGGVCLLLRPRIFMGFSPLSRCMILIGAALQTGLAVFYCLALWKKELLRTIAEKGLNVLIKLRLLRNPEQQREKLNASMTRYAVSADLIRGKRMILIENLALNILHRAAQIAVTLFCYLAQGGEGKRAFDLFALQSNVVLGANFIPIPGAMGVTDLLMLDGFGSIMTKEAAANLELLSRTTSFYFCILICGVTVLIRTLLYRLKRLTAEK